jgi:hypothetical protein
MLQKIVFKEYYNMRSEVLTTVKVQEEMEAVGSTETSVNTANTTWRIHSEDQHPNNITEHE